MKRHADGHIIDFPLVVTNGRTGPVSMVHLEYQALDSASGFVPCLISHFGGSFLTHLMILIWKVLESLPYIGSFPQVNNRLAFLDAAKHLYKRVCSSVHKSVTLFQQAAPWQPHRVSGIRTC